jgi:hypothetical protein
MLTDGCFIKNTVRRAFMRFSRRVRGVTESVRSPDTPSVISRRAVWATKWTAFAPPAASGKELLCRAPALEADEEAAAQWLSIGVADGVRRMSDRQPNHGWKLVPVAASSNILRFRSRETATDRFERPRLVIKLASD